jgi:hypothetical protein
LTFFTKDDPQEPIPIDDEENDSSKEEIEKIKTSRLEVIEQKQEGRMKWLVYWICGIESSLNSNKNISNQPKYIIDTSIYQSKFWSNVCDTNAIIAMALCGFFYAFFNKFTD